MEVVRGNDFKVKSSWATPVRADTLLINMNAYFNTLQTVNALKASHKYGIGGPINKLPIELVLNISDIIVNDERSCLAEIWSASARCSQYLCEPDDHMSEEEMAEYGSLFKEDDQFRRYWCGDETDLHKCAWIYVEETDIHTWRGRHDECADAWRQAVGPGWNRNSYLELLKEAIRVHFGLEITTNFMQSPSFPLSKYYTGMYENGQISTAWLHAPGKESKTVKGAAHYGFHDWISYEPANIGPNSCSLTARLKRAMNVLNLKPAFDADVDVFCWMEGATVVQDGPTWPKLVALWDTAEFTRKK